MKILFITDNFPPEMNAPATRTYEHAVEWVEAGAEVTVLTCFPNFPKGEVFDGYTQKVKQKEEMDGIEVIRLGTYITANEGVVKRTLDYVSFAAMASLFGLAERTDVIIATSPQFFTTWAAWFLSKCKRKPWIFELRDLWPESIATVGALEKKSRAFQQLENIEMGLYRSSNRVIANSPAFKDRLLARGVPADKIHVIPNGVNLSVYEPEADKLQGRKKLGIKEPFVVGYIGTHGLAHSLDFIIRAIHSARDSLKDIRFLFVGDGAEKEKIVKLAASFELDNVTFLDSVPKHQIPEYLSIIDVSLVPLKKSDTFKTVIPSKIFEACAMKKPILLGVEGQAKEIVTHYNAGLCFEPENRDAFIEAVQRLKNDSELYSELSESAHELAKNYDRKKLALEMLDIIRGVVSPRDDV